MIKMTQIEQMYIEEANERLRQALKENTEKVTRKVTEEVTKEVTKETLLGLLRDGLLSVADVAVRLNASEAEVEAMLAN